MSAICILLYTIMLITNVCIGLISYICVIIVNHSWGRKGRHLGGFNQYFFQKILLKCQFQSWHYNVMFVILWYFALLIISFHPFLIWSNNLPEKTLLQTFVSKNPSKLHKRRVLFAFSPGLLPVRLFTITFLHLFVRHHKPKGGRASVPPRLGSNDASGKERAAVICEAGSKPGAKAATLR